MDAFEIGYKIATASEDREQQRKALQLAAQAKESDINYKDAVTEQLQMQNQQLATQQKLIQNQLVSKDLTYAIDDFVNTGNTKVMNHVIKSNPFLQQKILKNYGVTEVSDFDFSTNKEHQRLAAKDLGLSEDIIKEMLEEDPEILEDFQKGFIVAKNEKGEPHLTALGEFADQVGYIKQVSTHKAEALKQTLDNVKNIGRVLTEKEQKNQMALDYFKDPENEGKTWADFEKDSLGKVPELSEQAAKEVMDLMKTKGMSYKEAVAEVTPASSKPENYSQVKAEDAKKWLAANPGKTLADYENLSKNNIKGITTAGLKSEFADLQVEQAKGNLSKDKAIRLQVLDKLFSTDNDEKRAILEKGIAITDKYKGNLFTDVDIDSKDIIDSKLFAQQAGIKPDTKANRELKDQFNTVKTGKRLVEEVEKLGDEELSRGLYDTGIQTMKKLLSDKKFEDMSEEQKAKALTSINMNTKLGMFLAKYIKSISGTAVAEAEYNRLKDLFSGNSFDNTQALKEGVKTFVSELDTQFKDSMQTSLLDNPATTLDLAKRYKDLTKGEETPTIPKDEETPVAADTYEAKYEKFKDLIGQVNPKTGKKLIGFEEDAPFNPIYEEVQ